MLRQKEEERKRRETLDDLVMIKDECQQLDKDITSVHDFASSVKSGMEKHTLQERTDSISEISANLQTLKEKIKQLRSRMESLNTLDELNDYERSIEAAAADAIRSITHDRIKEIERILVSLQITATNEEAAKFEPVEPGLEPVGKDEMWGTNNP